MITAQEVFSRAITLMDEQSAGGQTDWGDTLEYKNKALNILNVLQGELFILSDSCPRGEAGKRPVCPALTGMSDSLALDDVLGGTVLPYGLAAQLLLEENPAAAGFFQQRYEDLTRRLGGRVPAEWAAAEDVYGCVRSGFGGW